MRKTTEEILKEYLGCTVEWGSRRTTQQCQEICDFVGVGTPTARRWYNGEISPKGMVLVKVRYFLEEKNFEIHDLKKLDPSIYKLGYLIAHGFLNGDSVKEKLGYSDESSLLRILHGWFCPLQQKMEEIEKICAPYASRISERKIAAIVIGNPVAEKIEHHHFDELVKDIVHNLGTLRHVLGPLKEKLEELISDKYTPEQRQRFREVAGQQNVFDLSNIFHNFNQLFNASCSEQARRNYPKEKK